MKTNIFELKGVLLIYVIHWLLLRCCHRMLRIKMPTTMTLQRLSPLENHYWPIYHPTLLFKFLSLLESIVWSTVFLMILWCFNPIYIYICYYMWLSYKFFFVRVMQSCKRTWTCQSQCRTCIGAFRSFCTAVSVVEARRDCSKQCRQALVARFVLVQ